MLRTGVSTFSRPEGQRTCERLAERQKKSCEDAKHGKFARKPDGFAFASLRDLAPLRETVDSYGRAAARQCYIGAVTPAPARTHFGVLLLAHGAPDRLEDIPEFLLNVRGGRRLPEPAVQAITERYARIGGSPLLKWTNMQAKRLGELLNRWQRAEAQDSAAACFHVAVGMRNWKPFIADAVQELAGLRPANIIAICMAPQNSSTSVGLYRKSLDEALAAVPAPGEIDFVESWYSDAGLIAAFADRLRQATRPLESSTGGPVPCIFTAHSVPKATVEAGDPYEREVRESARLVANSVGLENWRVAFQSQGIRDEAWIGPTVESEIDRLADEGHRQVLIAPIGFVCDHVEILYDIDIVFREYGAKKGITVRRTDSLNDSPRFIQALADLVQKRITISPDLPIRKYV